jgi:hypothetical protein
MLSSKMHGVHYAAPVHYPAVVSRQVTLLQPAGRGAQVKFPPPQAPVGDEGLRRLAHVWHPFTVPERLRHHVLWRQYMKYQTCSN